MNNFRALFHVNDSTKWKIVPDREGPGTVRENAGSPTKKKGDEENIRFRREARARNISDWSRLSGDIHVTGSLEETEFSDVAITNVIEAETGTGPGVRSYTYRERIICNGLKEQLIGFLSGSFAEEVNARFPSFSPEEIAEARGLMAGHLAAAWEDLFDNEDDEERLRGLASSITKLSRATIRRHGSESGVSDFYNLAFGILDDPGDRLEKFLDEKLPGMSMAVVTELKLKISMPGRIVETNGQVGKERNTVTWSFGLIDSLSKPVEMFVRSELPAGN